MNKEYLIHFNDELEKIARSRKRKRKSSKKSFIMRWAQKEFGKKNIEKVNERIKKLTIVKSLRTLGRIVGG